MVIYKHIYFYIYGVEDCCAITFLWLLDSVRPVYRQSHLMGTHEKKREKKIEYENESQTRNKVQNYENVLISLYHSFRFRALICVAYIEQILIR